MLRDRIGGVPSPARDAFLALEAALKSTGFSPTSRSGTYNRRKIAGTSSYSRHSTGHIDGVTAALLVQGGLSQRLPGRLRLAVGSQGVDDGEARAASAEQLRHVRRAAGTVARPAVPHEDRMER